MSNQSLYCEYCDYKASRREHIERHLKSTRHIKNKEIKVKSALQVKNGISESDNKGIIWDNLEMGKGGKMSHAFENKKIKCFACGIDFSNKYNLRRHIKHFHSDEYPTNENSRTNNNNSNSNNNPDTKKSYTIDELRDIINLLSHVQSNANTYSGNYSNNNSNNNNINQNIQNNVNVQYLNSNFGKIPSIQSFQKGLQEDLKLTIPEANIIYDCFTTSGIYSYGRHIAQLLRDKYQQQIEANEIDILEDTYPFPLYANDSNHRHHHEKFEHSWEKSLSDDNIIKIIKEINTQVHRLRGFVIPIRDSGIRKVVKIIKTINGTRTAFISGGLLQDVGERPPITEELIMTWHPSVRDSYLEAFRRNLRLPVTINDE